MKLFDIHTAQTAPAPADKTLKAINDMLGFVPNVFAVMAAAPPVLDAFATLNAEFSKTSLSPTEREIVQIAVSVENGCTYCVAGHTAFAHMQKVPEDIVATLRQGGTLADPKLAALHDFARTVASRMKNLDSTDLDSFLAAGYSAVQAQEVILGVCTKVFSNLTSNLLDIPLDDAFAEYAWEPAPTNTAQKAA